MKSENYNSPEYKKSRKAYIAKCAFEYFISLLVADAFLAKFLTNIGISDSMIGVISSFVSLAFVFQLLSVLLIRIKVSTKKMVIFFDTISQLLFMSIYFVPFIPVSASVRKVMVIFAVILAYACRYMVSSICYKWANSYVDPTKRAEYSATKEIVSLVLGIIFSTAIGYIIDYFEGIGNMNGAFLFIAVSMFIINIAHFISLVLIKKERVTENEINGKSLSQVIQNTFGNKNFRNITVLAVLWNMAVGFSTGFMGTFKINDLMYSLFVIQLINTISYVLRIFVSKPFGRYSDKNSFVKGYELALYIAALAFLATMFTTKDTRFLVIIYTCLYSICMAGTSENNFNMTYSYVDSGYIAQAMAIKNSIAGLCGFGASIIGSKILAYIQANGNRFMGVKMYGQQLLAAISFLIVLVTIVFVRLVIAKQNIRIQ